MANVETRIGKDVIESLTLGMYEDSRFIYREYIQNAADQIDLAVELGILNSLDEGKIELKISANKQEVYIYDNATGIESAKVEEILKNIAKSTKDRSRNKGFRGIGRLGGIGYCDKLIFETSYHGESVKSYLVWDAKKLKAIINNREKKEDAHEVIDQVTEYRSSDEKKEAHYFKVTLEGITNEALLDSERIYNYLSMVSPVPYNKGFIFKSSIYAEAKRLGVTIDEYKVFVNKDQVFKAYTTSIYEGETDDNKKRIDEVIDLEFFDVRGKQEELLAWGWYSISSFKKAMPQINTARNIRLRKANIQVGLEDAITKLFKEQRGTKYFFGELHAESINLIPNARRDYFLENDDLKLFEEKVKEKFLELHKLYYFSSRVRNEQKKIEDFKAFTSEYKKKAVDVGFSNEEEKKEYEQKLAKKKELATKAERRLEQTKEKIYTSIEDTVSQQKVFDHVIGVDDDAKSQTTVKEIEYTLAKVSQNPKTKYITDDLAKLNKKEKKLVSCIFDVIDNALPKDLSNIIKEKIKEELR